MPEDTGVLMTSRTPFHHVPVAPDQRQGPRGNEEERNLEGSSDIGIQLPRLETGN